MLPVPEEALINDTNLLLQSVGLTTPFLAFPDLRAHASSMFVAIFQKMFQVRLKGINISPYSPSDYVKNVQVGLLHFPIISSITPNFSIMLRSAIHLDTT